VNRYETKQELEGDKAAQPGVFGLIYDTHPAAAQLFDDPVVRDGLANHELRSNCGAAILGGQQGQVNAPAGFGTNGKLSKRAILRREQLADKAGSVR
jgi:hypothetical protein